MLTTRSILVGILILGSVTSTRGADNLRVATFNINWGNVNLPDIQRAIAAADADVVCVQESTRDSENFLRKQFTKTYPHITFQGHKGRYAAERFGFLSNQPLQQVQYIPPVHGLFGTYFATITYNKRPVRIANVHLSPFVIPRGAGFRQAFQALNAVEAVHKKEIRTIAAKLQFGKPTLVCGDFNSGSTFTAPQHLKTLGLMDSFAAVTDHPDAHPTWHWPVGKLQLRLRIDYIFHTVHFRTLGSKIIRTKGSDHSLVVSELVWKAAK